MLEVQLVKGLRRVSGCKIRVETHILTQDSFHGLSRPPLSLTKQTGSFQVFFSKEVQGNFLCQFIFGMAAENIQHLWMKPNLFQGSGKSLK